MGNLKLSKENKKNILIIGIIVFSYAAERIIELFVPQGRTLGIVLAMIYTLLLMFCVFSLYKTEDTYFGLLAALIAYKMMPVHISFLSEYSLSASALYFIVQKAGMLMFMAIIYILFRKQPENKSVSALTVLTIMFSVTFFNDISRAMTDYFLIKTGSMLGGYFSQFACYTAAVMLILAVSYFSGGRSLRFAAAYETIALCINILKNGARIGYRILNSWHISKSYYVWVALYFVLILCFALAVKLKEKKKE